MCRVGAGWRKSVKCLLLLSLLQTTERATWFWLNSSYALLLQLCYKKNQNKKQTLIYHDNA